jgi:hypothetical protein|tara:strand:- start:188 stop:430 length:243 start_codon:yes stop_codon:yes gene_type:complete
MGRKRKNAQNIKTQLRAKSTAKLERALEGMLDVPDPEEAPDFESEEWCGPSPPHMIDGKTYEERQKIKKEKADEKARQSK